MSIMINIVNAIGYQRHWAASSLRASLLQGDEYKGEAHYGPSVHKVDQLAIYSSCLIRNHYFFCVYLD